jgi:hypothetical protein
MSAPLTSFYVLSRSLLHPLPPTPENLFICKNEICAKKALRDRVMEHLKELKSPEEIQTFNYSLEEFSKPLDKVGTRYMARFADKANRSVEILEFRTINTGYVFERLEVELPVKVAVYSFNRVPLYEWKGMVKGSHVISESIDNTTEKQFFNTDQQNVIDELKKVHLLQNKEEEPLQLIKRIYM